MQKCPKCAKVYDDEAKICRTCGAILDVCAKPEAAPKVVPKIAPEPDAELVTMADVEEEPLLEDNLAAWDCPQCKKSVPGNFDICWNCFSARDGQVDSVFAEIAAADKTMVFGEEDDAEEIDISDAEETKDSTFLKRSGRACSRCGSDQIVSNARVLDRREHYTGDLSVVVYGDPGALVFKDSLYGTLTADICGQCGHVELTVDNPAELFEHFRKSRK
jgi:hypothetical protein